MELLLQQIANGLSLGMAYALVALGLTLVFGVLHVVNFAHGEFYMLGALVTVLVVKSLGLPYIVALLVAIVLVSAVAWVMDIVAVSPVARKPGGDQIVLVSTYAAGLIIVETVLAAIGPTPIAVSGFSGIVHFGSVVLTMHRVFMFAAGIVMICGLYMLFARTNFGRSLRAVAQSDYAAKVVGIDVERIKTLTFVLAGGIAGLAGGLIAPIITFNATMGLHAGIHAFVVVVIGSMGSIPGAVVCGLSLGMIESVLSIFLGQHVAATLIYSLLLVTLFVRPQGLFQGALR